MKTQVTITNGSGWNNYKALATLKSLPVGTRGLMRDNRIALLEIEPYDSERPYGIAARYYNTNGDWVFTQSWDQNATADDIRRGVTRLLSKGITVQIDENAARIAAKELAAAQAFGYSTAAEHQAAREASLKAARQADMEKKAVLKDPVRAERAERIMRAMLPIITSNPAPEGHKWRIARDGFVGCYDAFGSRLRLNGLRIDHDDLYAWLHQHGYEAIIENRNLLFNAVLPEQR